MAEAHISGALHHRDDLERQTGLSVGLSVVTDRAMIDLRGQPDDAKFRAAAKSILKVDLPAEPRTSATNGDVTVLWMSIDQWLITLPHDDAAKALTALGKKLDGMFAFACDMSDARTVIRLTGDGAREVLMKGTSADLTAPDIGAGTVRRLLFAEIAAACHIREAEPDVIDLYVFRSYANYAWEWLLATARTGAKVKLYGRQEPPAA